MLSHFSLRISFFLSLTAAGLDLHANQCETLFHSSQGETSASLPVARNGKNLARLLTAPTKISTGIHYDELDKDFLDASYVLNEATLEQKRRSHMVQDQTKNVHVDFLARQLPAVTQLLDQISASDQFKTYFQISKEGKIEKTPSTVKEVIDRLRLEANSALENKTISSEFYTTLVIEILGLHYALWKGLDFSRIEEFEKYQGYLAAQARRPKGLNPRFDFVPTGTVEPPFTPLVDFLKKMEEVKRKIDLQTRDGMLMWPTFAALKSDDFQNWHLGIKPVAISLERILKFDGNTSDFFGLATHDITNHTLPAAMLTYREKFSDFKTAFFRKIDELPKRRAEIAHKIWFLATHEGSQVMYSEYLHLQGGTTTNEKSLASLALNLQANVIAPDLVNRNMMVLVYQLRSELHFYGENSPELRALSQENLQDEVTKSWEDFLRIYKDLIKLHFPNR